MKCAIRHTVASIGVLYVSLAAIAQDTTKPIFSDKFRHVVNTAGNKKSISFDEYRQVVDRIDYKKHEIWFSEFEQLYSSKPGICLLDLRSQEAYTKGHLRGALYLGSDFTEQRLHELVPSKTAKIVIYCEGSLNPRRRNPPLTLFVLPQIISLGYPNTFTLQTEPHFDDDKVRFGPLWETGKTEP